MLMTPWLHNYANKRGAYFNGFTVIDSNILENNLHRNIAEKPCKVEKCLKQILHNSFVEFKRITNMVGWLLKYYQ